MYQLKLAGITYHVEPYHDDGQVFAVIHKAEGMQQYGSDELSAMFSEDVHVELSNMLSEEMKKESEVVCYETG